MKTCGLLLTSSHSQINRAGDTLIEIRKNLSVSVIIPAYNEEETIGHVIKTVRKRKEIDEIIIIDDGSTDATEKIARECGATVIATGENRGKGYAMQLGASRATGDILLFLDADLKNMDSGKIKNLIEPFKHMADFVKTRFDRDAGRVTLLTAKPLLEHLFPEVAQGFEQPLSGQIGIRRGLLEKMTLESDYGVDVGILIDAVMMHAKIEEVYFGYVEHKEKDLESLDLMAKQVARVILDRASRYKRLEKGINAIQQ